MILILLVGPAIAVLFLAVKVISDNTQHINYFPAAMVLVLAGVIEVAGQGYVTHRARMKSLELQERYQTDAQMRTAGSSYIALKSFKAQPQTLEEQEEYEGGAIRPNRFINIGTGSMGMIDFGYSNGMEMAGYPRSAIICEGSSCKTVVITYQGD